MDIIFLGTSSGVPTKTRNVTAVAVAQPHGKHWYLVDCGEGTQQQLLQTRLSINALQSIHITHVHGDHCYGLPGLLASASMHGRKDPLILFAPKGIKEWITSMIEHTQLFLTYDLVFEPIENAQTAIVDAIEIRPILLSHRVPSYGYAFVDSRCERVLNVAKLTADGIPRGPHWGTLQSGRDIEYRGHKLLSRDYVTTTTHQAKIIICGDNDTPELLDAEIKGCDVLIHESTYMEDIGKDKGKVVGHSYAKQVASFAQRCGLPNLVLTHFSARYQDDPTKNPSISDLEAEAKGVYSGKLFLARDFDHFRLDKAGALRLVDR